MSQNRTVSIFLALLTCLGGIIAAAFAPVPAAQFGAFVAGIGLFALILAIRGEKPAPAPTRFVEDEPATRLPEPAELLDASDDPLLIVQDRRVVMANPAARELLGAHIEGVDVRLAIRHPAASERLIDRPGERPERQTKTDIVGLGEAARRWEMNTTMLGDGARLVRLTDRSETHAAEQMRVDFVANASHELRTPLATLLGFLETLQDVEAGDDPERRLRFVRIMFDEATRMRNLIEDLISLSRIEAERYSVPRDPIDLVPLVEEVGQSLTQLIEERGCRLVIENQSGETIVAGDRSQLAQLLTNLIANALRYGRPGTPVRVRFDDAGPELLRLSVIDQGEGIAAEHLPRLTERFYRVDAGRSRSIGGTGLGLAIVKHIAQRHRGRLDISSTLGEGTTARVYLPRAQAPALPMSSKSHALAARDA